MHGRRGPKFVIFWLGCYIFRLHWLLYFYKGSHPVVYGKLSLRIAFLYLGVCFTLKHWIWILNCIRKSIEMNLVFLSIYCYFSYVMRYSLWICYHLYILALQIFLYTYHFWVYRNNYLSQYVQMIYKMMNAICYYNSV